MPEYKFKKPWKFGEKTVEKVKVKNQDDLTAGDMFRLRNVEKDEKGNIMDGSLQREMLIVALDWSDTQVEKIPLTELDDLIAFVSPLFTGGKSENTSTAT